MALASALASALSDAHATMAHAKVHEDYAAADPFSSPVPPSKQNAPPATVFKPTSSVTPPSPPRTPTSADKREPASTVAARRALRAAVERVERRCARVEAVVASRLDALDARCSEMKTMMVKLVENQPTKTCLDAVKAAREAAARSEAAARQAQKHAEASPPLQRERKKSLSDRLAALSPLKKQPVVEEDALVAAYASYQDQEPPSIAKVPNDFATIQAAIDAAEDDGLVIIAPGLYREALVVARPVRLEAAETTSDDEGIGAPTCSVTVEAPVPGSRALLVTAAGSCTARGIAWRCSTEVNELARPCAAVGVKGGRLALESCAVGSASALSGVNAQRGATLSLLRVTGANCRHTGVLLSGAGTTATLERCDLSENGAHGLEIQDAAKVEDALRLRCAHNALFGVFVSDPGSSSKLRRADLSRNRRCGVWVQSGAACDVSDATFSRNGEHGVALSEDKSSAVLRRCAFAGRDDHLACFNGAAFSSLDARDCCYEPGDDDSPRLEAGL
jgi:hypothetical protein